jgi:serine/threonine protein kinase
LQDSDSTTELGTSSGTGISLSYGYNLCPFQITIGELLGQGEFGTVYRGKLAQGHAEISVAVKLHKVKVLNKEAIKEVSTEARLLREYKHPNIVQFYGVSFDKVGFLFPVGLHFFCFRSR